MALIETIASEVIKSLFALLSKKGLKEKEYLYEIQRGIGSHLTEVRNWSSNIHLYGMPKASSTDDSTVSLTMNTVPRRFRGLDNKDEMTSENELLLGDEHYVILGDPGAGKTTTIKRIARKLLTEPPSSDQDWLHYPILIRLRELDSHANLYCAIADTLGLKYESKEIRVERKRLVQTEHKREQPSTQEHSGAGRQREVGKENPETIRIQEERLEAKASQTKEEYKIVVESIFQYFLGDTKLEDFIGEILNSTKALLLLDGLDELSQDLRESVEHDISAIALRLSSSKIILSCRTGDYQYNLESFNQVEICPLAHAQIKEVSRKWLKNPDQFLSRVAQSPYYDLVDRPLFLAQLILLFKRYGYLPDQPSTVCHKIVKLMLEEWDSQQSIERVSRYGGFDPETKLEFLAELSFHLTYKVKTKIFTTSDLIAAYSDIYTTFNLPSKEAERVAREIESHTGIIRDAGNDRFEFSHLSLQEYLCGYYIARDSFSQLIFRYIREYPAPIAIATARSSNPSNFFAAIVLSDAGFLSVPKSNFYSYLDRLTQEKPFFSNSVYLGFSIIGLLFNYGKEVWDRMVPFLNSEGFVKSIAHALTYYSASQDYQVAQKVIAEQRLVINNEFNFSIPERGSIPSEVVNYFLESGLVRPVQIATIGGLSMDFRLLP